MRIKRISGAGLFPAAALLAASGCSAMATEWDPDAEPNQSSLHLQGDVMVGALGELKDVADVGQGGTLVYAAPLGTLENGGALQFELLGSYAKQDFSWSETSFDIFGNPHVDFFSASGDVFRLGGGLRLELPTESPLIPYLDVGLAYHSYEAGGAKASGPGGYVGGGVDVDLGNGFTIGIDGRLHAIALSGDLKGAGIVPVIGLALGVRF